jgi:hypothetical protein
MKKPSPRFISLFCLFVLGALLLSTVVAKEQRLRSKVPWSVGFWMEGTVTNVTEAEGRIQFRLNGNFSFHQIPEEGPQNQVIKVFGEHGISATVQQSEPFFAMTTDWSGGSLRKKGDLLKLLKTAAGRGGVVKFELFNPKMEFGPGLKFTLLDAKVIRATDADLR